jgi:hypothetical protein
MSFDHACITRIHAGLVPRTMQGPLVPLLLPMRISCATPNQLLKHLEATLGTYKKNR